MPEIYCKTSLLYNRPNVVKGTKRTDSLSQEMRWPRPFPNRLYSRGGYMFPLQMCQRVNKYVKKLRLYLNLNTKLHLEISVTFSKTEKYFFGIKYFEIFFLSE